MHCKLVSEDELMHYGVKGMKWGIRRYQNADGSLTDVGKRRIKKKQDSINRDVVASKARKTQYAIDRNAAMKAGPQAYARWATSGATSSQRRYIANQDRLLDAKARRYSKKYKMVYNTQSGLYELKGWNEKKKKRSKNR